MLQDRVNQEEKKKERQLEISSKRLTEETMYHRGVKVQKVKKSHKSKEGEREKKVKIRKMGDI